MPAPRAKTRPAERITTRTGRVASPTLHSTPSASARARVYDTISEASTATTTAARRAGCAGERTGSDGGQHDPFLERSSVESRNAPNGGALARHARVAPVERIHDRADDKRDTAEEEVALPDERGGEHIQRQAGQSRSRSVSGATRSGALRTSSRRSLARGLRARRSALRARRARLRAHELTAPSPTGRRAGRLRGGCGWEANAAGCGESGLRNEARRGCHEGGCGSGVGRNATHGGARARADATAPRCQPSRGRARCRSGSGWP